MINLFYFLLNFHLLHNFQCVEMQLITYNKVSVIDISNIYIYVNYEKRIFKEYLN